jgi:hypothetical protein
VRYPQAYIPYFARIFNRYANVTALFIAVNRLPEKPLETLTNAALRACNFINAAVSKQFIC